MPRASIRGCVWLVTIMLAVCTAQAAEVVFDAATTVGNPIPDTLFGHNLTWRDEADFIWDAATRQIKDGTYSALDALKAAAGTDTGSGKPALIRFPGGSLSEEYHWRRGVGWKQGVGSNRPKTDNRGFVCDSWDYTNEFGTDELMAFTRQMYANNPDAGAIITVNWWGWNNPDDQENYYPDKGMQEAANWVEYCNGVVNTTLIQQANAAGWVPCEWVDDVTYEPSLAQNAIEYADGLHSWRSDQAAPAGYFAWLRYYFAQQRGVSDPGPYNIKYWEIGNEDEKYLGAGDAEKYRGNADPSQPTNPERGVIDYSVAMKEKDPTIKIGAAMNDAANLQAWDGSKWAPTANPSVSAWDAAVLDTVSSPHIDFLSFHPYIGGNADSRCTRGLYGDRLPNLTAFLLPYDLDDIKDYEFRVRAAGRRRDGSENSRTEYPLLAVYLVPYNSMTGLYDVDSKIRLKTQDPCECSISEVPEGSCISSGIVDSGDDVNAVWACVYYNNPMGCETTYNTDYKFTSEGTAFTSGRYGIWVRMMNNTNLGGCNNGRRADITLVTIRDIADADVPQNEEPILVRPHSDHTAAVFAAPSILEKRIQALRNHAESVSPQGHNIELAATEFAMLYSVTPFKDEPLTLKSALVVADTLRMMMEQDVEVANYWLLSGEYLSIAQPKDFKYGVSCGCGWNQAAGECPFSRDMLRTCGDAGGRGYPLGFEPNTYFKSSVAYVYELLAKHFGRDKLAKVSSTGIPTFNSSTFDPIQGVDGTDLLSVLATRGDTTTAVDGLEMYNKYYVLVINKDAENDQQCTISFRNLQGQPTSITSYTLRTSSLLDRQHLSTTDRRLLQSNRYYSDPEQGEDIAYSQSGTSVTPPSFDPAAETYSITSSFEKATVTVLEITLGEQSCIPILQASQMAPDGMAVKLSTSVVSALFPYENRLYIQDPKVPVGMEVTWDGANPPSVALNEEVLVQGFMSTSNGMRSTQHASVVRSTNQLPDQKVPSLGMGNRWLGGCSPNGLAPALKDATGIYNVGVLVNVWGRVTRADDGAAFFYIDDGSGLRDGSGNVGIRVIRPAFMADEPEVGEYRWVVGISSADTVGGRLVRAVRLRRDASEAPQWGKIANNEWALCSTSILSGTTYPYPLSVIPRYPQPEAVFRAPINQPALELSGYLSRYHTAAQSWVTYTHCDAGTFGNCFLGDCFWLYGSASTTMSFQGRSPEWDTTHKWNQWMGLPRNGTVYLANPLGRSVPWESCWLTDGKSMKRPSAAATGQNPWITTSLTGNFDRDVCYSITTGDYDLALIVPDL